MLKISLKSVLEMIGTAIMVYFLLVVTGSSTSKQAIQLIVPMTASLSVASISALSFFYVMAKRLAQIGQPPTIRDLVLSCVVFILVYALALLIFKDLFQGIGLLQ